MGRSDTLFSGILSLKLVPGSLTSCSTSGLVLSLSLNLKFNSSGSCDKFELGNNGVDSCTGEGGVSGMSLNFKLNSCQHHETSMSFQIMVRIHVLEVVVSLVCL